MRLKLENKNIFFISDLHFQHKNILKYDNRPFSTVDEMDESLILNWNNKVQKNDIVFYIGDFAFCKPEKSKEIAHRLNGKIHFILGNHDNLRDIQSLNRFETINDYFLLSIKEEELDRKWQEIAMMHYPIFSWDKEHHGSFHLHGHCHQSLVETNPEFYKRKVLDVGCNGHNYTPLSYDEIKNIMNQKTNINNHH